MTEQAIIETYFRRQAKSGGDPVNNTFHLAPFRISSKCRRVIAAMQLDDLIIGILDDLVTTNDIGIAKTDLSSCYQALELAGGLLPEIITIDINLSSERKGSRTHRLILGMVCSLQILDLVLCVIRDNDLQGMQHGHAPWRMDIEIFPNAVFKHSHFNAVL